MLEGLDTWKLLAGLGIFLFGMFLMEESIRKLSGRAFKKLIRRYTSGKLKSTFSGTFITAILQSSSAVSLMVLAFVGAGIITMENAIGVILGSNIGTTATAWIVATFGFKLNIESFALPLIGTGGLGLIFLAKSERYSNLSKLLVGFGFLFMGLDYMKVSVDNFASQIDISTIPDFGIVIYLLMGIILTGLMQSSSATMAIVLTSLNSGILDFYDAAAMVIGSNVGTTVTIMLGSIGATQVKKRVALSHFTFNMVTGVVAFLLMPVLIFLVRMIVSIETDAVLGVALFHTFFNILGVLIFFPFIGLLARFLTKRLPNKRTQVTIFINNTSPEIPEAGVSAIKSEVLHLLDRALRYNLKVLNIDEKLVFSRYDYTIEQKTPAEISLENQYQNLKLLQSEIFTFAAKVQARELTEIESRFLHGYLLASRMILHASKTLKDIRDNFEEFENSDNVFLNDQYVHFRKRLIETYLSVEKILSPDPERNSVKALIRLFKNLKKVDKLFVEMTTHAINASQISDIDVSTALIVNRAFVQSSRQVLLAIKETVLTSDEISEFEQWQEVPNPSMKFDEVAW